MDKLEVWKGSRIGLSDKYPEFQRVPYRFLTMKKIAQKQKTELVLIDRSRVQICTEDQGCEKEIWNED